MNKEIKIIDLLNKIANGEEVPKKIEYGSKIFFYDGHSYLYENNTFDTYDRLEEFICYSANLNDKVEIIEEDNKIGKLDIRTDINTGNNFILNEHGKRCYLTTHSKIIAEKVNELIDEIEKLKENHEN